MWLNAFGQIGNELWHPIETYVWRPPDLPMILVLVASIATTGIAGAIIGIAGARLRGPYLAGATLSLAVALPQVPTHFASLFGGNQGINVPAPAPPAAVGANFSPEQWLAWICIAAALVTFFVLANIVRGATGRRLRMVRDNEVAARLAGIDVARTQVLAFVISAVCAGLAGSLFAYWVSITSPTGFTLNLSLSLLTAIVIGGLGSLSGAVLGSFASRCLATSVVRLSMLTLLMPATYFPSHFTRNLKFL